MLVAASVTVVPFSGLKSGAAGPVASQAAVAVAGEAGPWLAPSVAALARTVTTTSALPAGVTASA